MIRYLAIFFMSFLIPLGFSSAFGEVEYFTTNKSLYYENDQLNISGNVSYDPENTSISIIIFNHGKSTFVHIEPAIANPNGSFSASIHVGGPTWATDGIYPIQVTYMGSSLEKTIEYQELSLVPSQPEPTPEYSPEYSPEPTLEPTPENTLEPESLFVTLKLKIPNFPSLDKSPQYYIDRYYNEPDYKSWFDSQFPFNSIEDVVGYKLTSLDGFPSLDKSPQYYIDRYYNDPDYKSWFDSQFSGTSIHNILGYADPVPLPPWIQDYAGLWATGKITDSTFVTGIEFLLENNIIMISNIPSFQNTSGDEIPYWIRNNALWWSQDLISEDEFVNSLKFLIQEGIIVIN